MMSECCRYILTASKVTPESETTTAFSLTIGGKAVACVVAVVIACVVAMVVADIVIIVVATTARISNLI